MKQTSSLTRKSKKAAEYITYNKNKSKPCLRSLSNWLYFLNYSVAVFPSSPAMIFRSTRTQKQYGIKQIIGKEEKKRIYELRKSHFKTPTPTTFLTLTNLPRTSKIPAPNPISNPLPSLPHFRTP